MFFSRTFTKTVVAISDTKMTMLTLSRDTQGFFVEYSDQYKLPEGTIVQGEILKADLISNRIKKMQSHIKNKNIDIILPYTNFVFTGAEFEKTKNKQHLEKNIRNYFKTTPHRFDWFQTHVCEYSKYTKANRDYIVFRCLSQDIFQSYFFLFQKEGLHIQNITPDILAFDIFFKEEKTKVLYIGERETRLIEYTDGIFTEAKTFGFSYTTAYQDIIKLTKMQKKDAQKVLQKYGFLRSHPEEKVYRKLIRSLGPLIEVLQKTKNKHRTDIVIIFEKYPINGISDALEKALRSPVRIFDITKQLQYPFREVLSIHHKKIPVFAPLMAQALQSLKEK